MLGNYNLWSCDSNGARIIQLSKLLGNYNSDELPYYRELTEAEEKVNFEAIQKFLEKNGNDFEESAKKELTAYIEHVADNPDEEIKLPDSYVKLIETTYKTAYNYGKLSAANEQSLPAPSTKKEQREHVKRYVDLVTEMQTSDIELMIKEARVKAPLNLADEDDAVNSVVSNLILASAVAWVLKVVLGTKGTVSSQGMNDGRNDTFDRFASEHEAVWQWSSVLETETCSVCRALDGKTMTTEQKNKSIHQPLKHINCECVWVQILKLSDDYTLSEITGIDDDQIGEIERIMRTKKQDLINEGSLRPDELKKTMLNRLSGKDYTGSTLGEFENAVRRNSYETVAAVGEDGKVFFSKVGESSRVGMTGAETKQLTNVNAIMSHNHPSGSSLSVTDIKTASNLNAKEIRAVGSEYSYSMIRPDDGWPSVSQIDTVHRKYERIVRDKYTKLFSQGKITKSQFNMGASHEIMLGVSNDLGIMYKKERVW